MVMRPDTWRTDGWPLCSVCGEDELAILDIGCRAPTVADLQTHRMYCYVCVRYTVKAGEGAMPAKLPDPGQAAG